MTLAEAPPSCFIPKPLPTEEKDDWSFAHLKRRETLWGPHGYHRYPAKFIPHLVRRLIERYSVTGGTIADPFLGSATTGIEALRSGRRFWGCDISPVALLISQAKCFAIRPKQLAAACKTVNRGLEAVPHIGRRNLTVEECQKIKSVDIARATDEERFSYWFPREHAGVLDSILDLILEVTDQEERRFLLCGFSNILRRSSIWLSGSTKPQKNLSKILSDPVEQFRKQMRDMIRRNSLYWDDLAEAGQSPTHSDRRYCLSLADVRRLPLKDGAVDAVVTSPPYATCYEYIDLHQLTQLWFERKGVLTRTDLEHTCIGGKDTSLRGQSDGVDVQSPEMRRILDELSALAIGPNAQDIKREVRALRFYFCDMQVALSEMARILSDTGHLILVVGDSYKRGVTIPTSLALSHSAESAGLQLTEKIVRRIPARVLVSTRNRQTGRFSSVAASDGQAFPIEDILVFKKQ
jgi:DNA modification methylase